MPKIYETLKKREENSGLLAFLSKLIKAPGLAMY
jgi:hypothetical protein